MIIDHLREGSSKVVNIADVAEGQKELPYLVDVEEEDGEVEEDDNEEGQDEDDGQRGENPQQVLHHAQVVLHVSQANPFLQRMEHTHLPETGEPPRHTLGSTVLRSDKQ